MLPKKQRLNKALFDIVKKKGSIISKRPRIISLSSNDKSFKAALVISKKSLKNAVDRNRLRRRTYEALKTLEKPEGWIIIYPPVSWLKEPLENISLLINNTLCLKK